MHDLTSYPYSDALHHAHHHYLDDEVSSILAQLSWPVGERRVFELGCGNGSFAKILSDHGYAVTAIDTSIDGINLARCSFPGIAFHNGSAYDDLSTKFGKFNAVVSLEVVEHIFVYELLEHGGAAIISTPYHSYVKNLALAVSGKMDAHFTALWDYGHVKFWSMKTLRILLLEAGFQEVRFRRVGRIPPLAKSIIAVAQRP
jgi:2-polyprenyl-6-hydroxyphenyl methylase/3-demethylubiquinone-9 3-methyltransferase